MRSIWSQRHRRQTATATKAGRAPAVPLGLAGIRAADVAAVADRLQAGAVALRQWAADLPSLEPGTPEAEQRAALALGIVWGATHALRRWVDAHFLPDPDPEPDDAA
jgi:hypothetical protein